MAAAFLYRLGVRSLETVLAVSGGRVGTFLGVCYDRNLAAARKEKARERTVPVETAFLYRLGERSCSLSAVE